MGHERWRSIIGCGLTFFGLFIILVRLRAFAFTRKPHLFTFVCRSATRLHDMIPLLLSRPFLGQNDLL